MGSEREEVQGGCCCLVYWSGVVVVVSVLSLFACLLVLLGVE